jgi:hypothetical protein
MGHPVSLTGTEKTVGEPTSSWLAQHGFAFFVELDVSERGVVVVGEED